MSKASKPSASKVPRKRPRGRPVGDREAKRIELLQAAEFVIAREGYSATSLRKVARKAGGTTGAVTYYFENKEAMFAAVAEFLFDKFEAWLRDSSKDLVDVRGLMEHFVLAEQFDEPDQWSVLFQLLMHARHVPAFADVFQRRYATFREVLAGVIRRGQEQGRVRDDISADILADQLSAIADGWMLLYPIERERFKPRRVKALIDAIVVLTSKGPAR